VSGWSNESHSLTNQTPDEEVKVTVTDYGISKSEFLDFISVIDKNMETHASRLFDIYDEDKSGYLDFRELITCLSVVKKGGFEEKLRLVFDIYDVDGSGYLCYSEIGELMEKILKPHYINFSMESLELIIRKFDVNSDGFISFREF
jgi:Ca2+-binding EF-hand superfamily protein